MSDHATVARVWSRVRYQTLLPCAAISRSTGRLYARLAGAVEAALDRPRRDVGVQRIARSLGVSPAAATSIFRRSLVSEALEEADSVFFMRHPSELTPIFDHCEGEWGSSPAIYGIMHFGSPVLGYVYLRQVLDADVSLLGRRLSPDNPMPSAKRDYGLRKVAWVESLTGRRFIDVDAAGIAKARRELVEGRSVCAAVDVPGDIAARTVTMTILGENLRMSAGVFRLASLAVVPLQPFVAISRPDRIAIHAGPVIEPSDATAMASRVAQSIAHFVGAYPSEWWMWSYVVEATR